jgi:hypothetical protein
MSDLYVLGHVKNLVYQHKVHCTIGLWMLQPVLILLMQLCKLCTQLSYARKCIEGYAGHFERKMSIENCICILICLFLYFCQFMRNL